MLVVKNDIEVAALVRELTVNRDSGFLQLSEWDSAL